MLYLAFETFIVEPAMPHPRANGIPLKNLPRAERYEAGRALRKRVARETHADCPPASGRDPVAILALTDGARIPELLPIRYERMVQSPFTFLRGAAAVMAHDLASLPQTGAHVQACGDCHLLNFGAFNSPEERILFDINDFDETLPGVDFTVDLKRLAASVAVAALDAAHPKKEARAFAAETVKAYRWHMAALAKLSPLEIWHSRIDLEKEIDVIGSGALRRKLEIVIARARGAGVAKDDNFPHLVSGADPKIVDKPPTIFHLDPKADQHHRLGAEGVSAAYRKTLNPDRRKLLGRFVMKELAFKVVGGGSVGT